MIRILAALVLAGLAYRLWPVLAGMPALADFFMTEDGYLMQTVARNMAIGLGMSVSEGTIATNGVQPLATFLFALPFLATGGDKVTSLAGIHLIQAGIALAALFAVRRFALRLLAPRDPASVWPWAAALLWFLGPISLRHSMNGLETGLYTLVLLLTLLVFARVLDRGPAAGTGARLGLGAMCGVAVLTRNDAVFFVATLFLAWAAVELFAHRTTFATMIRRLVPPGLLAATIVAPWLLNNLLRFGSVVPVSGIAQSHDAAFGQNAALLPAKLFENIFPMVPVPGSLETEPAIMAAAMATAAVTLAALAWRVLRHGDAILRALVFVYAGHGAALAFYYGFLFGAPHFLSRYLAPLAPLMILGALVTALEAGRFLRRTPQTLAWAYTGGGIALSLALLLRAVLPGATLQGHEQVVAWARANIPDKAWVGAIQTGTLGYWHDRTYNLDGKVNPAALAAKRAEGHVRAYVLGSEIAYLIDWQWIAAWVKAPAARGGVGDAFEVVVDDPGANLAVLRRKVSE